jgi:hypothetical protein
LPLCRCERRGRDKPLHRRFPILGRLPFTLAPSLGKSHAEEPGSGI